MSKKLSVIERKFVNAFINNSGNATLAYQQANPSVTGGSARVLGSRLLTRVDVRGAIERRLDKDGDSPSSDRQKILDRLLRLADKSEEVGQFGSSVNAVREYGKISGMYEESDDGRGYITLIQNILGANVQVNIEKTSKEE